MLSQTFLTTPGTVWAVALLNAKETASDVTLDFSDLNLTAGITKCFVTDLWTSDPKVTISVPTSADPADGVMGAGGEKRWQESLDRLRQRLATIENDTRSTVGPATRACYCRIP